MAKRSTIDAEKTRQTLIAAALKHFSEKGYKETSLADICDTARTTKGALFHHFQSKESLFKEVWVMLQTNMDLEARRAAIAARSSTDPYAAFMAGCRIYLEWAAQRDYQQIVLTDGRSVLGQAGWYEDDHKLGNQNVMAGVRYLAKKGLVDTARIKPLAVLLQSALNGAGYALMRGDDGVTSKSVFEAFEVMVKSLR